MTGVSPAVSNLGFLLGSITSGAGVPSLDSALSSLIHSVTLSSAMTTLVRKNFDSLRRSSSDSFLPPFSALTTVHSPCILASSFLAASSSFGTPSPTASASSSADFMTVPHGTKLVVPPHRPIVSRSPADHNDSNHLIQNR